MILRKEQLDLLMTGNTLYVDIGKDTDAAIYYGTANNAFMRLPGADSVMRGRWNLGDEGYAIDWQGGPSTEWAIDHEAGRFTYMDGEHAARGTVAKIVPGDAENLAAA